MTSPALCATCGEPESHWSHNRQVFAEHGSHVFVAPSLLCATCEHAESLHSGKHSETPWCIEGNCVCNAFVPPPPAPIEKPKCTCSPCPIHSPSMTDLMISPEAIAALDCSDIPPAPSASATTDAHCPGCQHPTADHDQQTGECRVCRKEWFVDHAAGHPGVCYRIPAAPPTVQEPTWVRLAEPWSAYPVGTEAMDSAGCSWTKLDGGAWRAKGGDIFPQPGASALQVRLPTVEEPPSEDFETELRTTAERLYIASEDSNETDEDYIRNDRAITRLLARCASLSTELDTTKQQLADALLTARYESDLAGQALASRASLSTELDRLTETIAQQAATLKDVRADRDIVGERNLALSGEVERLRIAGSQLANVAYNLSQDEALSERRQKTLTSCYLAWDAALSAARSSLTPPTKADTP